MQQLFVSYIKVSWVICFKYYAILLMSKVYCVQVQYIPRYMHTVFALLCFVVVIHWLIFPYPSGLLHWHCGNLTIAPVPAKQPWWIWINTSCEFIMNDCITTTKQNTTKPCTYFLRYTVCKSLSLLSKITLKFWPKLRYGQIAVESFNWCSSDWLIYKTKMYEVGPKSI